MSNLTVNSIDLTGYLTYGKFNVNDYVFELGRGTIDGKSGMILTVKDSDGNLLSSEMCYDGERGITEAEEQAIKELWESMREALPTWTEAEEERVSAEEDREHEEDWVADDDSDGGRKWLYGKMKELYNKIWPKLDDDLAAVEEAKRAAEEAARNATTAAEAATETVFGGFKNLLFYKDGDTIQFESEDLPTGTNFRVSSLNKSPSMNAHGYVTSSSKSIHIKFPVAKMLTYITGIECTALTVSIANSGGYAFQSGPATNGNDFLPHIQMMTIDKVQNCIHLIIERSRAWVLNNNEPVSCRCHNVSFTLHAEGADEDGEQV